MRRMKESVPVALLGVALLLSSLLVTPAFAISSGTGKLYMYSDSAGQNLLPQTTSGTLGYLLPDTGTTVYVQVKNITEPTALSTTGCSGSAAECTNIKLQWNGYTEIITGVPVNAVSTGCPTTLTCWNTISAAWEVGNFSSSSLVTMQCGQTGIVIYGQGTSDNGYYTTEVDGSKSSQGHFFGPGTTTDGSCGISAPEFPVGILPLLALAIPALLVVRLRLLRVRCPSSHTTRFA
ncbi:MAG: hypothetical protein JRM96_03755 [Nitrososphaerota archaeon]|jgi:hypothetical protein|nr:hypothetical protein [Nitrososphaerota archaeon]MDG6952544.1 hypothetical protein [Nitrososphaerota archaeon]